MGIVDFRSFDLKTDLYDILMTFILISYSNLLCEK